MDTCKQDMLQELASCKRVIRVGGILLIITAILLLALSVFTAWYWMTAAATCDHRTVLDSIRPPLDTSINVERTKRQASQKSYSPELLSRWSGKLFPSLMKGTDKNGYLDSDKSGYKGNCRRVHIVACGADITSKNILPPSSYVETTPFSSPDMYCTPYISASKRDTHNKQEETVSQQCTRAPYIVCDGYTS